MIQNSSVRPILRFCVAFVLLPFGLGSSVCMGSSGSGAAPKSPKAEMTAPQNTDNQTTCAVRLGDGADAIALTLSALQRGEARIRVANPTSQQHHLVKIRVTNFHLRDVMGDEVQNAIVAEPSEGTLDPLESLIVLLRADSKHVFDPGVYSGVLVLDDVTKGTAEICKSNIQITLSSPQPFFSNRTAWAQRWLAFSAARRVRITVPLNGYVSANTGLQSGIVARKDYGDFWRVTPKFSSAEPTDNVEYFISELPHAGEYVGSIQIASGDSGKVTLKIYVQDAIYWPVLVSAIGVLIALWSKRTVLIGFNAFRQIPEAPEWAKSAVAFVIAIVVGLQQYYFGKPFGSSADYGSMFLVGAGAKVSLDFLVATASRLFR